MLTNQKLKAMRKIIMTMALAAIGVLSSNAGILIEFFDTKVRPAATMVIDSPESELASENLKSGVTALLSEEALSKIASEINFKEPVRQILDSNDSGNDVKAWMLPASDNTEALLVIKSAQANVVMVLTGSEDAVMKSITE